MSPALSILVGWNPLVVPTRKTLRQAQGDLILRNHGVLGRCPHSQNRVSGRCPHSQNRVSGRCPHLPDVITLLLQTCLFDCGWLTRPPNNIIRIQQPNPIDSLSSTSRASPPDHLQENCDFSCRSSHHRVKRY